MTPEKKEALQLAVESKADVLLMDEKFGREAARQLHLRVAGVLGELVHAKRMGRIDNVRAEIERLKRDAHFFVDPRIEEIIASAAGE